MGHIYQRTKKHKDGRVQVLPTWWIKYSRNGRAYYESAGSKKKDDAKRLLRLREGSIERGEAVTSKIGRLRFEEAAADLVCEYRTEERRSLADLSRRINLHLDPFFRGRRMAQITTADVRRYIDRRQKAKAARHRSTENWPRSSVCSR